MVRVATGRYRPEHCLIAERVLGRRLARSEEVHHIDGNRANNANTNLMILPRHYHHWLHGQIWKSTPERRAKLSRDRAKAGRIGRAIQLGHIKESREGIGP
jgi:HNH endonuclease